MRDAEIAELERTVVRDEQIRRLDVHVHHAIRMNVFQCLLTIEFKKIRFYSFFYSEYVG